jgi:hypothetical protein
MENAKNPEEPISLTVGKIRDVFYRIAGSDLNGPQRIAGIDLLHKYSDLRKQSDEAVSHCNVLTRLFVFVRELFSETPNSDIDPWALEPRRFLTFSEPAFRKYFNFGDLPIEQKRLFGVISDEMENQISKTREIVVTEDALRRRQEELAL